MSLSYNDCLMLRNICDKINALKNESSDGDIDICSDEYWFSDYTGLSLSFIRKNNYTVIYLLMGTSSIIMRFDDNRNEYNRIRNTSKDKIIISNNRDNNLYTSEDESFYPIPDMPRDEDEFDSIRFQNSLITDSDYHLDSIMLSSFVRTIGLHCSNLIDLHLTPFMNSDILLFIHENLNSMCDDIKNEL